MSELIIKYREKLEQIYRENGNGVNVLKDDLELFSDEFSKDIESSTDPVCLYRYTDTGYFNLRNLELEQVYLSNTGELNDIFEGLQIYDMQDYTSFRECLCNICDIVKTSSFSEIPDSSYMWGHYADSGKGICVEYDLRLVDNKEILKHLYPVLYFDERFDAGLKINDLVNENIEINRGLCEDGNLLENAEMLYEVLPLYLVKGKEWCMEREWRIAYDKIEYTIAKIDSVLKMGCITSIIKGYRLDNPTIDEHLSDIAKRLSNSTGRSIAIKKAVPDRNSYKMQII